MPSKLQFYTQMADITARQVTGSFGEWTAFLETMGRLYKYPFHEQLMIFAQKPNATACADYDLWNKQMGRYVRRGSKGIALLDTTGDIPRLKYVFDVSDTGGRENSRRLNLWEYKDEHHDSVTADLENRFGVSGEKGLADQLEQIASKLVTEYWNDNRRDILGILADSFLEEYDDYNVEVAFRNAATVSTTYALMCSGNKRAKDSCTTHNIKCELVEKVVLATVQAHISMAIDIDNAMKRVEALDWEKREIRKIDAQISAMELDVEKFNNIKMELYEDLKSDLITKDEYHSFKNDYDIRIQSIRQQIAGLVSQRNAVEGGLTSVQGWFAQFRKYENIEKLTRLTIVSLIERVEINENKDIHVKFRHADQFTAALEYLQMQRTPQGEIILMKEAGWNGKNIPQTAKPVAQSVVL